MGIIESIKASEGRDIESQVLLGMKYKHGDDVKQDYKKTVFWFERAAKKTLTRF
jgi:TPR repeat protein